MLVLWFIDFYVWHTFT